MDARDFKSLRTSAGFSSEVDFAITCMPLPVLVRKTISIKCEKFNKVTNAIKFRQYGCIINAHPKYLG